METLGDEEHHPGGVSDESWASLPADFLHRTTLLLGRAAVNALRGKTVAIAGCGGAGGAAAILLARMGVGGFTLADPGTFDPPDINRQWAATTSTLGRNKAEVYTEILRDINPAVRVETFREGVTETTLADIVAPSDAVVDCLDLKVPLPLRLRVYQEAQRRGRYCVSAPIIGTGTLLMMASPDGMPLEGLVQDIVELALATSRLPGGFRRFFFPDNVEAMERHIAKGMAASLAIAPALAAAFIATELLTVLLRDVVPRWPPPTTLPDILVVEPLRASCRVVSYREILPELVHQSRGGGRLASASPMVTSAANVEQRRRRQLHAVGHNTVGLDHEAVDMDLLTDSWSDVSAGPDAEDATMSRVDAVEAALRTLFPYAHLEPVCRGRVAEALLAEAVVRPGSRVLTNALFPTAHYHLSARGAQPVYVGPRAALPVGGNASTPVFTADVDLTVLERELANGGVSAVYIELCNNALGGQPVHTANLDEVHRMARARGALVVLDASRAYTNAAQLCEPGALPSLASLQGRVAELCSRSDACTASLTKDFASRVGGMVACNDGGLARRLRQLARMLYGVVPSPRDLGYLHTALHLDTAAVAGRVELTRSLAQALAELGVPVIPSPGSHAVFVDAKAFLPHLSPPARPDVALAAELFAISGIRGACNLIAPEQREAGVAMVRFAVRTGTRMRSDLDPLIEAFRRLIPRRDDVPGLRAITPEHDGWERFELA